MLTFVFNCCAIISSAVCLLVKRNVATGGGTKETIPAISSSLITPGPLGISETNPSAEAPYLIARAASSTDEIQQIFTRVYFFKESPRLFLLCKK